MRIFITKPLYATIFVACVCILSAGRVVAQTPTAVYSSFTNLHVFAPGSGNEFYTNADGEAVWGGIILDGDTLYGATEAGGTNASGTIFSIKTNGTGFTLLHVFAPFIAISNYPGYTNTEGACPYGRLIISGSTLYGTTLGGITGPYSSGTVYRLNTDGSGFTNIHYFGGAPGDGAYSRAGVVLSGNTLYGTTTSGGAWGNGMIFSVSIDGSVYSNLYSFSGTNDGCNPFSAMIISGDTLFGVTSELSTHGAGTIFSINTNGSGFTNLHHFSGSDQRDPNELTLVGNKLYGMTSWNFDNGFGTIFSMNTDGTGFTNLYVFPFSHLGESGPTPYKLVNYGKYLYGDIPNGGSLSIGSIFRIATDGSDFLTIYNFNGVNDGGNAGNAVSLAGNSIYGTANGRVFSFSFLTSEPFAAIAGEAERFFRISGPSPSAITAFLPDGNMVWSNSQPGATYRLQTSSSLGGLSNWSDCVLLTSTNSVNTNLVVSFH